MTSPATALKLLHPVWRKLPPGLRRQLYATITGHLATPARWTAATPRTPSEPYIVAGPLSAPTGLGQASRLVLAGLIAAGRDVSAVDLGPILMQPATIPVPVLPLPRLGPGTVLLMSQPPTIAHSLAAIGRGLLRDKLRLGLWAWEIDRLPPIWLAERRFVHAVAAPSRFVQTIFETTFNEPVRHVPWPLGAIPAPPRTELARRDIVFGAAMDLGSTVARKNPFATVTAFRGAFTVEGPARLLLKLRDPGSAPQAFARLQELLAQPGAPIDLELGNLGPEGIESWWRRIDVLVSLHRSEGFGLLPAEAMQRGVPVIATDWSATAEFVTRENGWPVEARPVPVRDDTGRYALDGAIWGEPDPGAAVAAMRAAASDRDGVTRKGAQAARTIARAYSTTRFLDALERPVRA
ncbi:glycosyltransferase [uncultured Enterovirga sp.]|uniref:glycosyltransferase n=1 Tax=uncultured Enterovirga sp. TaxID=2026352 RepID=UPI0035CA4149